MFNAGIMGYSGARGVLGALRAVAPRPGVIDDLLNAADAQAVAGRLRALSFVRGIDSGTDPASIEKDLRQACVVFGGKLARFLGGAARDFIDTYMLHYEVHNVKVLFRRALAGPDSIDVAVLFPVAPIYRQQRKVEALDSPEKVVAALEESRLARAVRISYDTYRVTDGDLFRFELALDREYLLALWNAAGRIRLYEGLRLKQRVLVPVFAAKVLVWGAWLKQYHRMSPEEIMNLMLVPHDVMAPELFLEMIRSGNVAAAAGASRSATLRERAASAGAPSDLAGWDKLARREAWAVLARRDLGIAFDISTLLTALMSWEMVIDDAIAVLNGKALGLDRDEIEGLLATVAA